MGSEVDKLFGAGDAWAKDHEKILTHARGLYYDKVPGVSLPSADAPKQTWISAMDKFNAWKASERTKPESERWWYTYPRQGQSEGEGGGSSGGGGGGGGGDVPGPTNSAGQPIGPYPYPNVYFPQLTQAYERPTGNDYRDLFAAYGLTGPLAQMEGAYTPGTVQGAALVPGGILEYKPPQLNVGVPRFAPNITGMLDFGVPGIPDEWLEYLGTADEEGKKKVEVNQDK
jgi:hypothetical protein